LFFESTKTYWLVVVRWTVVVCCIGTGAGVTVSVVTWRVVVVVGGSPPQAVRLPMEIKIANPAPNARIFRADLS
jgi:hypothetical protein